MNYPLTSVGEIIGRLMRRVGLKDTSLVPDLNEWIAEAMQLLQTSVVLEKSFETVTSRFHKAKDPCGMIELWAVEYCGARLRHNNGVRDPRVSWSPATTQTTIEDAVFVSTTTKINTPTGNFMFDSEFKQVQSLPWNATQWYKKDNGYILTSFEEGKMTLYFGRIPTDRAGFLMIPDEGNYKQALTYYLRECMATRGYRYGDLNEVQLHQQFEIYQGRAITNITYPSVDQVQATADTLARLLPNMDYYEDFFTTIGPETNYGI